MQILRSRVTCSSFDEISLPAMDAGLLVRWLRLDYENVFPDWMDEYLSLDKAVVRGGEDACGNGRGSSFRHGAVDAPTSKPVGGGGVEGGEAIARVGPPASHLLLVCRVSGAVAVAAARPVAAQRCERQKHGQLHAPRNGASRASRASSIFSVGLSLLEYLAAFPATS